MLLEIRSNCPEAFLKNYVHNKTSQILQENICDLLNFS